MQLLYILIGAASVVLAGVLGIVGTLIATRGSRHINRDQRRERAYVDILLALDDFALQTYKASFDERTPENLQRLIASTNTERANRARATYSLGSPEVRRLYEASLQSVLYWRRADEPEEMQKRWENISVDIAAIRTQIELEMSK